MPRKSKPRLPGGVPPESRVPPSASGNGRTGRPPTVDLAVAAEIAKRVAIGVSYHGAAGALGVASRTFDHWWENGERDADNGKESVYADFWRLIARARDESEVNFCNMIVQAATPDADRIIGAVTKALALLGSSVTPQQVDGVVRIALRQERRERGDWRAAAFMLQARFPNDYQIRTQLSVTGRNGEPLFSREATEAAVRDASRRLAQADAAAAAGGNGDPR